MKSAPILFLSLLVAAPSASPQKHEIKVIPNQPPLAANAFNALPLTAIQPRGWLLRQLQIQSAGLSGHLDEFWKDVGPDSGWLGGAGESWERGPYFMDGLVPLAYLTGDGRLIAKVRKWMDWTLDHQGPDGAIGPPKNQDWWPNMVMLKALTQFQEATGDPRIIPVMTRYFEYHQRNAAARPLKEWARFRWQDEVLSILWLYNRTGNPRLLDLAHTLHDQGFDWEGQFSNFQITGKVSKPGTRLDTHGVNNGQALKTAAVWSLITGDSKDHLALYRQFEELYRYHGLPNGIFSADEHLAGLNPTQGTELCTVVETMFSIEQVLRILGDAAFGDRLEKIAFNPLPGTLSADMWSHQYDQQPNQIECSLSPRDWTNNGPDSNIFGLEPNFGCCTANFHQGWPKFVGNLWMTTPSKGIALTAYGPREVRAPVADGTIVHIVEQTEYPFRETVSLTVNPARPSQFYLQLRIPDWASNVTVEVNSQPQPDIHPGTFLKIQRRWQKGDRVQIHLPMAPRVSSWFHNSIAVERGPLVYALKIGEDWKKLKDDTAPPLKSAEWSVLPTTPWNYALVIDPDHPAQSIQSKEHPIGDYPFSPEGAPVELTLSARQLDDWKMEKDQAGTLPQSPVQGSSPIQSIQLIPYGCAKLRITAFPWSAK